ncbi:hypothetical protein BFJ63_vAg7494 [Fusarium oxysporum f. sp. narcissi]|uniref:Uncharacterized protein n=3 Tax=Fusarium oxysporum TaxID=5507 RepID=A0A420ST08_FUSOX|nr:hypothetical protein BFJ65_g5323 [Fusarium oxysporum f. sp. cepae]RKL03038.1 hypothetical protein BFJ68_g11653 [Fusarium oxysporum]RYC89642.1 hypothetical protein BFJ63_vAg7494 [Fusarium oxysporum f. sp. narcissi]RKK38407.1 hypothetical protein BFJ67_g11902 [Fusarium oxysporum f. sp. cepae]RKK40417.1 hypothetical protein BFJ66_g11520 [Fusarium oxysporum f. sp. cepae]
MLALPVQYSSSFGDGWIPMACELADCYVGEIPSSTFPLPLSKRGGQSLYRPAACRVRIG